ncbi:unnamed protein product [Fraxinus pennsylvanica]|uniref:Pentatricopeptide repeat-containing protein n=1 Tax=Fraxinus pennsylvanica TaxID=56036 RepID=A0AAD2ECQ7_9LAMI|nr:unnamed protein product [Fraxinus pennsylvanica]
MFHHVHALRLTSCKFLCSHIHVQHKIFFLSAAAASPQWQRTTDILLLLCDAAQTLSQTQQIHAQAILHGHLPRSVSISSALILSYANLYSHPSTLYALFSQTLPFSRSAFLHNTLIRAYTVLASGSQKSYIDAAPGFLIYNDLFRNTGFPLDDHTFSFVLKLCADFLERAKGLEVHGMLIKTRFNDNVFVNNTLLLFYGNCRDLGSVENLFNEMPKRDLIALSTVIRVFSDNGCWLETVRLFKDMVLVSRFRPDAVTVVSVLPVCAGLEDVNLVSSVHCYVFKVGLDGEVRMGNAMVDAYGKCGNVEALNGVFNEMTGESVGSTHSSVDTHSAYLASSTLLEDLAWLQLMFITQHPSHLWPMLIVMITYKILGETLYSAKEWKKWMMLDLLKEKLKEEQKQQLILK